MTFRLLINQIREAVSFSLLGLGYPNQDFDISEPPRKEFGDLTCNVAFQLSKKIKRRPFDIAKEIIERQLKPYLESKTRLSSPLYVQSVELHPAGYINFKANFSRLSTSLLNEVLQNPEYGFYDWGKGEHIIIEHTSVNPNKALHVGHLRNVVLGDCIYRILKATNHKVTVLNYVDDSGLQVADIVVGFKFAKFPIESPDTKFDHYCGDEVYVKINKMYKEDSSLEEKRRLVLKEIEEGKSDIAIFASEIAIRVLNEQLKTCWRIKAHYDLLNFESHILVSNLWKKSFALLKEKGIVTLQTEGKNNGCWVIKPYGEEEKVIVRSDGTPTYIAKDIPYAAWKLGIVEDPFFYYEFAKQWDDSILWATTLNPNNCHSIFNSANKTVTIIDSRQSRLQRIISQVLSNLYAESNRYQHLRYETVTLSSETAKMMGLKIGEKEIIHMSGRQGIYVNADYALDILHANAYREAESRNPNLSKELLNTIAEDVAISAVRYSLIKHDLDRIITFDITESLKLEGDTGPYLQYAFARSQRILDKSTVFFSDIKFELLILDPEIDLIKQIAKFDLVIEETTKTLSPKLLARYAYVLATVFNIFYEKVPVLREQNKDIMIARLSLVKAFGLILRNTLSVLGIPILNKM